MQKPTVLMGLDGSQKQTCSKKLRKFLYLINPQPSALVYKPTGYAVSSQLAKADPDIKLEGAFSMRVTERQVWETRERTLLLLLKSLHVNSISLGA